MNLRLESKKHTSTCSLRGLTLVEVMVVVTIILVFTGSALAAFLQVIRVSQKTEYQREAINSLRSALEDMNIYIRSAGTSSSTIFKGTDKAASSGIWFSGSEASKNNLIEQQSGKDDNFDWTPADDRGYYGLFSERGIGEPSFGDDNIDIDVVFNHDTLQFTSGTNTAITYYLGSLYDEDGIPYEKNVLIKKIENLTTAEIMEAPIAFNVVSLNFLYWDSNAPDAERSWLTEWDASHHNAENQFEIPASVYVEIMIYKGAVPLTDSLLKSNTLPVERLGTVINIEKVIRDRKYKK